MKSHLLTAVFLTCFSFAGRNYLNEHHFTSPLQQSIPQDIRDFTVHRLSNGRVLISWYTEGEPQQIRFEVMRQYGTGPFVSLGVVAPKSKEGNTISYAFIDENRFSKISFYRLKKTKPDSVIFYSMAKEVAGVAKER
jgi:hypothetical protein